MVRPNCESATAARNDLMEQDSETIKELASFQWPITTVEEFKRLLQCPHAAPTDLVGFEFSSAVRDALISRGRRAISVDRRDCETGGVHAKLDVLLVLDLRRWQRAFFFPPCFQQLRADTECLPFKQCDGRAFWGCLTVVYLMGVAADLVVVEQPDTIVADFYGRDTSGRYYEFCTADFGDHPNKFVRLHVRGAHLALPPRNLVAPRVPPPPVSEFANTEARDRAKSTWRPFANLRRRSAT